MVMPVGVSVFGPSLALTLFWLPSGILSHLAPHRPHREMVPMEVGYFFKASFMSSSLWRQSLGSLGYFSSWLLCGVLAGRAWVIN